MSDHDTRPDSPDAAGFPLSPAGHAREADILRLLHAAADARRARRAAVRRTALAGAAIAAGAAAVWLARPARPVERPVAVRPPIVAPEVATNFPRPSPTKPGPAVTEAISSPSAVTIVTNDVLVMCDCTNPPPAGAAAPDVCLLSGDQLLAALAETGESYGLVRRGDHVEVVRNGP